MLTNFIIKRKTIFNTFTRFKAVKINLFWNFTVNLQLECSYCIIFNLVI